MVKRFKLRTILLLLLVLLSGLYLLRWPLFGGLIEQRVTLAISTALGAAVDLGDLEGSLLAGFRCPSLRVAATDDRARLRSLSVDEIRVGYNLWKLAAGDLASLSISASGASCSIDLDRPGIPDTSAGGGRDPFSLPDRLPVADIELGRIVIVQGERALHATGGSLALLSPDERGLQSGSLRAGRVLFATSDREDLWEDVKANFALEEGALRLSLSQPWAHDGRLATSLAIGAGDSPRATFSVDVTKAAGRFQLDGEARLGGEIPVDVSIRTRGLDLSHLVDCVEPFVGRRLPLWGDLDAAISIAGPITNPGALESDIACRVARGGWLHMDPVDLQLSARLDDSGVTVERCAIAGNDVDLTVADGTLPMKDWVPRLDGTSADFNFRLQSAGEWARLFELIGGEDLALLADARIDGEGRLAEGLVHLARGRIESPSAQIRIAHARFGRRDDRLHIEVAELEGEIDGREIALTDPLVVEIAAGRVEIAPTRFSAGTGSIVIDAEINPDRSARVHAALSGADSSLMNVILPAAGYDRRVDWDGLEATLDLRGRVDALSGELVASFDRLRSDQIDLEKISLRATLTPQRIELHHLRGVSPEGGSLEARLRWEFGEGGLFGDPREIDGLVEWRDVNLASFDRFGPSAEGAEGRAEGSLQFAGSLDALEADLTARFSVAKTPASVGAYLPRGCDAWDLTVDAVHGDGVVRLERLDFSTPAGRLTAAGQMPLTVDLSGGAPALSAPEPIRWKVEGDFTGLDLGALAPKAKLTGLVSGRFAMIGPLDSPSGQLTATAQALKYDQLDGHDLFFKCRLDEGTLNLSDVALSRSGIDLARGAMSVELVDRAARSIAWPGAASAFAIKMHFDRVDLAELDSFLGAGVGGAASLGIEGAGTLSEPRLSVALDVEKGVFPLANEEIPIPVDLQAKLLFEAERVSISALNAETVEGAFLRGRGVVPLGIGWDRIAKGEFLSSRGPLSGKIESSTIDLAPFDRLLPHVRHLGGRLSLDAEIGGTLSAPEYTASLTLADGVVRFERRIPSLEEIELSLRADRTGIHIDSIDAEMGAGPLHAEGVIAFDDFKPESVDLKLVGDHVLLSRGKGLRVRGDLDLALDGPIDSLRLSGGVALSETRFVRHIPLIPGKGPPSVDDRFQPFSLTDPYLGDVVLDVRLVTRTPRAVVVDNNLLSGELLLDMSLKGTGKDPFFRGTATFNEMVLKFPNSRFQVDAGRLSFTEQDPYMPRIELSAQGRRQSYDISFTAWGPLNDPEMTFSTIPPLPEEDVLVLVTTGMLPDSLRDKGVENEALKQVGAYLGMELFQKYFGSETVESGESIMDRIELSIGTEVGSDGTDNVLVEYRIQGPWSLQVERDIYADMNLGLVYRIRFR